MTTPTDTRVSSAREYIAGVSRCLEGVSLEQIAEVISYLEQAYLQERQVFIIGNGGSASTASHMACDLNKNIMPVATHTTSRRFRAIALTDNIAWITALGNDLGYESVFAEQLRNLVQQDDLLVVISGSGNSRNIIEGVRVARSLGAKAVGLLGFDGGAVQELLDACVVVSSTNYGFIEDVHMILDHLLTTYFRTLAHEVAEAPPRGNQELALEVGTSLAVVVLPTPTASAAAFP